MNLAILFQCCRNASKPLAADGFCENGATSALKFWKLTGVP